VCSLHVCLPVCSQAGKRVCVDENTLRTAVEDACAAMGEHISLKEVRQAAETALGRSLLEDKDVIKDLVAGVVERRAQAVAGGRPNRVTSMVPGGTVTASGRVSYRPVSTFRPDGGEPVCTCMRACVCVCVCG